jgi:D-alanyl-D-alanine carboxypeptidase (penicillin-binding protein 5/6)
MNTSRETTFKKLIFMVVCMTMVSSFTWNPFHSQISYAEETVNLNLNVKSAILIEVNTGHILYESNADEILPPASMAKMMTEYLVLENIANGKIKWEDMVSTSKYAAAVIGSGQLLAENEKLTVKQMFEAVSIYSANDASVALAEYIGGTEEIFAQMMNEKAKELGMSDQANFMSSTGLSREDLGIYAPKEITGETMMSARDVSLLAYRLIKDHPEVLNYTSIPSKKLKDTDISPMINWNWMLEGNKEVTNFKKFAYQGLDGLKTGHTDEAGYCFTGTAERNGLRLISVVMGTTSEPMRFEETRKLLDYGFNNFEIRTIVQPNVEIESLKNVAIKKGIETSVNLVTKEGISFIVNKSAKDEDFEWVTTPIDENKRVAPILQGDTLGTLVIKYENSEKSVDLIATQNVDKAGFVRLMFRSIRLFFSDLFTSIKDLF